MLLFPRSHAVSSSIASLIIIFSNVCGESFFILLSFVLPPPPLCCHLAAFNRSHTVAPTWLNQHRPNYFIFSDAFIGGAGSREICQFLRNKYHGNFWDLNRINDMSGRRVLQTCLIFTFPVGFPEFINCIRIYYSHSTHWTYCQTLREI